MGSHPEDGYGSDEIDEGGKRTSMYSVHEIPMVR